MDVFASFWLIFSSSFLTAHDFFRLFEQVLSKTFNKVLTNHT